MRNRYISEIPINLKLSGATGNTHKYNGRGITFEKFDNFMRAFIPGKQIFFQCKELQFLFSERGAGWGIIVIRFYGGSSRNPRAWKEYTIRFELNVTLYDLIDFFSTKKYFVGINTEIGRPKITIGISGADGKGIDFQKQFIEWDLNFGKKNEWATPLQIMAIKDERTEYMRLCTYFIPANKIPPSARRKYKNHAAYRRVQQLMRKRDGITESLGWTKNLSIDEIKALYPTAVAGYTGSSGAG